MEVAGPRGGGIRLGVRRGDLNGWFVRKDRNNEEKGAGKEFLMCGKSKGGTGEKKREGVVLKRERYDLVQLKKTPFTGI